MNTWGLTNVEKLERLKKTQSSIKTILWLTKGQYANKYNSNTIKKTKTNKHITHYIIILGENILNNQTKKCIKCHTPLWEHTLSNLKQNLFQFYIKCVCFQLDLGGRMQCLFIKGRYLEWCVIISVFGLPRSTTRPASQQSFSHRT